LESAKDGSFQHITKLLNLLERPRMVHLMENNTEMKYVEIKYMEMIKTLISLYYTHHADIAIIPQVP
jgi:hypothetical protein